MAHRRCGDATKDVQVTGVVTTKTGYVIRFKDQLSTETAKANTEWLEGLGNGTKLVRPRFGVVIHRTPTENVKLSEGQTEAITNIMEEKGIENKDYRIVEVAWLKRQDKPLGHTATHRIWFESAKTVEWTINNGLIFVQQYVGSMSATVSGSYTNRSVLPKGSESGAFSTSTGEHRRPRTVKCNATSQTSQR